MQTNCTYVGSGAGGEEFGYSRSRMNLVNVISVGVDKEQIRAFTAGVQNIFKETIILVPGRRLTRRASWRHWGSFQWRKEAQRRSVFEIDAKSERQSTPRILSASASAHIWWMTILKLLLNLWIYYRRPSNCEVLFSTTTRCLMSTYAKFCLSF